MDNIKQVIAKNLIKYRKAAKMTQLELAELLMYSDKNISKWERGEAVPDILILKQLADMYHISVNDFLQESDEECVIKNQIEPKKSKKKMMNKKQMLINLLSVSLVWLVATVAFGLLETFPATKQYAWWSFILALPITMTVVLVFTSIWCTNLMNAIMVSLLIWTSALAIFICVNAPDIWMIFIVAIPLQILDILWFILRKVNKNLKFHMQRTKNEKCDNNSTSKSLKKDNCKTNSDMIDEKILNKEEKSLNV